MARQKANQAVRTVKFSNDRVDLLAYAEHNQAFHMVDARRYDARQTVQACSQNQGISGITFCPEVWHPSRARVRLRCAVSCLLAAWLLAQRYSTCFLAVTAR